MSAKRAGIDTLAVDFFGDLDLSAIARRCEVLHGDYPDGFDADALIAAFERLTANEAPLGFVYGAGFEDRPALLERIEERWPILGTSPAAVRALKDPERFADLCRDAQIAHPQIARSAPSDLRECPGEWLSKKIGGSGGSHVRAATGEAIEAGRYLQRLVPGERWSAGFVAAGGRAFVLGFTWQWVDASPDEPYRYGGAVGPLAPPEPSGERMRAAIERFSAQLCADGPGPLTGLCSADFVLSDGGPVLLEINPRFGATIDVFDTEAEPLIALHLAACRGDLPTGYRGPRKIRATGLAWTDDTLDLPAGFIWPAFTRDRTGPPASFLPGQPLATIVSEAETQASAVAGFHRRVAELKTMLGRTAA